MAAMGWETIKHPTLASGMETITMMRFAALEPHRIK
jgi:hypothetical protein